jgi:hypothetical protein
LTVEPNCDLEEITLTEANIVSEYKVLVADQGVSGASYEKVFD